MKSEIKVLNISRTAELIENDKFSEFIILHYQINRYLGIFKY